MTTWHLRAPVALILAVCSLGLTGWSLAVAADVPELKKVESPTAIPGLVDKVTGSIGHDFMLDMLPNEPRTLEEGFQYLVTESKSDIIRETLIQWSPVYGADFAIEHHKETLRVFVFAGKPDFSGEFVYAVSQLGYRWPVFLSVFVASGRGAAATPEEDWQRLTKEGWAALEAGRTADAEGRMKEALALAERRWPDQPRVAGSLSTLAQVYAFQKRYKDAEPLYRRALAILENSLGPDHPDLAPTLEAYSLLLTDLKRPAEAKELEARAVALKAKAPELRWQQRINDGFSAFQQGRLADAERTLGEAVKEIEQSSPRHPLLVRALEGQAQVYEEQGTPVKAEPMYRRALELRETIFGPEHASLQGTLLSYARVLRKLERVPEAAALERRADEIRLKSVGKGPPR